MSNLNQFLGGGGVPVGGLINMPDAGINPTINGVEYLRVGAIKAYSSGYAASVNAAPQLGVYGADATSLRATAAAYRVMYAYVGTRYVQIMSGNSDIRHSTDLVTWTGAGGSIAASSNLLRPAVNGTSHIVVPSDTANTAHSYSANGTSFSSVGGTFTTYTKSNAIAYGNSWWVALSDLSGNATSMSYINNANPSGTWTVAASPSLGGTINGGKAIAYGGSGNWFVAVGASASKTAGKIATCITPSGTWTDRTSSSGITFDASSTVNDIIFDGTYFVAIVDGLYVWRTTDPTGTWTLTGTLPIDTHSTDQVGTTSGGVSFAQLSTDGAGKICASVEGSGIRYIACISTDSGATWNPFQVYAKSPKGATSKSCISYANGKWIANYCGNSQGNIDLGSLSTPNYIGMQNSFAQGFYVRIK